MFDATDHQNDIIFAVLMFCYQGICEISLKKLLNVLLTCTLLVDCISTYLKIILRLF